MTLAAGCKVLAQDLAPCAHDDLRLEMEKKEVDELVASISTLVTVSSAPPRPPTPPPPLRPVLRWERASSVLAISADGRTCSSTQADSTSWHSVFSNAIGDGVTYFAFRDTYNGSQPPHHYFIIGVADSSKPLDGSNYAISDSTHSFSSHFLRLLPRRRSQCCIECFLGERRLRSRGEFGSGCEHRRTSRAALCRLASRQGGRA